MTTDSAASGTAYHCGVKTKSRALGVDDNIIISDCPSTEKARVKSVLDYALEDGKPADSTLSSTGRSRESMEQSSIMIAPNTLDLNRVGSNPISRITIPSPTKRQECYVWGKTTPK